MTDSNPTEIIRFNHRGVAHTFVSYLKEQGIEAQIELNQEQQQHQYTVYVLDTSHVDAALAHAKEFALNPQASKFQKAAWETGQIYDEIKMPKMQWNVNEVLAVPFTSLVLVICLITFAGFFLGFFEVIYNSLSIQSLDELIENQQWWRLIGPNFLHFGIAHIAFNLLWWWILGARLERTFGTFWLVILFITASLFANVSQLIATGPNFGGMSGVVYALFGFVWWIGWLRPAWGVSLPNAYIGVMLAWLALGFAQILPINMANQAHLFGLLSGCVMAALLHLWVKVKP